MKIVILMAAMAAASFAQLLPFEPSKTPTAPAAPGGEITPDTVVATVSGISVTAGDVTKLMRYAPPNLVQIFRTNPEQAIGTAYTMKFLAAEAERTHLDQKDTIKETLEMVLTLQKENILAGAMVNEVNNGYAVKQEQIDEFYKNNQSRYEEANIKIILIAFKPGTASAPPKDESVEDRVKRLAEEQVASEHSLNTRSREQAQKLAGDVVKQLRTGADFGALVTKYSDDAESKASGGDFGTPIKPTSSFAQEIKKAVFQLKQGEISEPVEEGYGFYIIRLEQMTVQPKDDVTAAIAKEIRDTHSQDYFNDLSKRMAPQVSRPDFFLQIQKNLAQQAPASPGK